MASELLSSKVVVIEEEPRIRGIATGPTSVAGAIGITERGPIGVATLCTTFDEFDESFGGFTASPDLALAATGFFENGGSRLWVVRTCHYDDVTDPTTATATKARAQLVAPGLPTAAIVESATAEPYALADGSRIAIRVAGIDVIETVDAHAARIETASGPFALVDGATLDVRIDGALQSVVLHATDFTDITAATATELAAALNVQLVDARAGRDAGRVFIDTDSSGRASSLEIVGGTAAPALGFTAGAVSGAGNVRRADAVTIDELRQLLAAHTSVGVSSTDDRRLRLSTLATGASVTLEVLAAMAPTLGLPVGAVSGSDAGSISVATVVAREPGSWAARIAVAVRAPSAGAARTFDVAVLEGSTLRELFRDLTLNAASARFIERVMNDDRTGSAWVRVALSVPVSVPTVPIQRAALAGGDDGLTGLDDADFVGSDAGGTGLRALDRVLDLSILMVPGRASPTVHGAMLQYAEVERGGFVFAVLDPPAGLRATEIVDYVASAALEGSSELGALYWPRLRVPNPKRSVFGSSVDVIAPPSGVVAGVYARTDAARPGGVYDAPAGIELGRMFGVLGFETDEVLEERKRDLIFPHRINPLTTGPTLPRFIDGARTLKGTGNFPFVSSRRGVSYIERALKRGLEFVRHRNPTDSVLAEVDRTARAFLLEQTGLDAFQSRDPEKAFFLEVSSKIVSVPGGVASRVLTRVGLAMNAPAEFVIISVSQDTRAIEAALAGNG